LVAAEAAALGFAAAETLGLAAVAAEAAWGKPPTADGTGLPAGALAPQPASTTNVTLALAAKNLFITNSPPKFATSSHAFYKHGPAG